MPADRWYYDDLPRMGAAAAGFRFAISFTVVGVVASVVNVFALGLPLAGIVYFFRNLRERR